MDKPISIVNSMLELKLDESTLYNSLRSYWIQVRVRSFGPGQDIDPIAQAWLGLWGQCLIHLE